jgi:hypothetical protein
VGEIEPGEFPKSAPTLVALSQAHARKGDKAAALKDVEQALAIDPMNAAAKRQLDQLKAPAGAAAAPAREHPSTTKGAASRTGDGAHHH